MTVYRFDAVLHLGCRPPEREPTDLSGAPAPGPAVARHVAEGGPPAVWRGVRNARLGGPADGSVDPEWLWDLGARHGWRVRVGCAPGAGSAALDVWAGAAGTPDDHFGLALPARNGTRSPEQPPLPPGRAWLLTDALRTHLLRARDGAEPADRELPVIQLLCDDGTGQE
jgi:hypothetical protein